MKNVHLIVTVDNKRFNLIDQFIKYYIKLGITNFILTTHTDLNLSLIEKESIISKFADILKKYDLKSSGNLCCSFSSKNAIRFQREIIKNIIPENDWVIWTDIDEFQEYWDDLNEILDYSEKNNINFIQGILLDRIEQNGNLKSFQPSNDIFSQYPLGCDITKTILKGSCFKVTIAKAYLKIKHGHHYVDSKSGLKWADKNSIVHHFKWDNSVINRLKIRISDEWKNNYPWWIETQLFYDHIEAYGKINLDSINVFEPEIFRNKIFNAEKPVLPEIYFKRVDYD